jgi:hypothetical protein
MKRIQITVLALFAGFILFGSSACLLNCVHGSGHQQTEDRKVGEFSRIDISSDFKVILKQDSSMSVKITADDNLFKYIKTVVHGNMLHIYTRRNICDAGPMTIYLGVRNLDEIKASGAVEIVADGKITAKDMRFRFSGNTRLTMDLNAANVTTGISGDTEMNLKGQATSHDISISGAGKIYVLDFVVGDYNIETSGDGHCEINVLHSLHVQSSGASEVKYRGNPSDITNDKSGASSVEKID